MSNKTTESGINARGYDYGSRKIAQSPVTLEELEQLKLTVRLTEADITNLKLAGDVLEDQTGEVIDTWRGIIGSTPHLAYYFTTPDGKPDDDYKARVKERFKQ